MIRPRLALFCFLVSLLFTSFSWREAGAALTRYISTSGTSSGSGTVNIIIETFSKPDWPGADQPQSPASPTYSTSVPIPAAHTAVQTTSDIRDSVDAILGGDYTVTIVTVTYVQINRPGAGTFTMTVHDLVPGQAIFEYTTPPSGGGGGTPAMSLWETAALALLALGVCLLALTRSARRGESGSPGGP